MTKRTKWHYIVLNTRIVPPPILLHKNTYLMFSEVNNMAKLGQTQTQAGLSTNIMSDCSAIQSLKLVIEDNFCSHLPLKSFIHIEFSWGFDYFLTASLDYFRQLSQTILPSSVPVGQFQLSPIWTETSSIITVSPAHPPLRTSIFGTLLDYLYYLWSWNLVWKVYWTKLAQLAN